MDVIKTQQISSRPIEKVVVHPLVLLSIVDNYNRVAKDTRKRVVGVLLGSSFKGTVDVTNSYAGSDLSFSFSITAFLYSIVVGVVARICALILSRFMFIYAFFCTITAAHSTFSFTRLPCFHKPSCTISLDPFFSIPFTTFSFLDAVTVPFEEDDKDPSIWFLDHNYHESMFSMFKRINAKEHVVGWYSTGPKLRENDLDIHGLFNDYVPNPVLVIIDVEPKELGIPTKAYYAVEEVKENATQKSQKVFVHVPSEIAAHEVEEIGVEHLLRDVKDTTISTLATEVSAKLTALKGLDARLKEIRSYLDLVIDGKLPLNHEILYHLQDVFNLLPNLNVADLIKAFAVKTNDMMLVIYLSSLIRSVIALHNLINNKMLNKEHERAEDSKSVTVPSAAA
ncbi:26S proteasome regulatory subunit N8 [Vigna unguiculata]|uniref:26S proteasome regulatory subunit N8 n=1 Tax=Vigna unguiculata TaxID=3917 RepID=A0A4D6MCM4_VIGUN|nr:26S proteasome regulatory subunit N8 [Vigna unguiculata]